MVWLLLWPSLAEARSGCAELKPKRQVDPQTVSLVGNVLQTALGAAGVPTPGLPQAAQAASGLAQLQGNEGARSWALYQICILKETGMLSTEKAQELTTELLTGRPPTPAAPVSPASTPALVNPWATAPAAAPPAATAPPSGPVAAPTHGLSPEQAAAALAQRQAYAEQMAYVCKPSYPQSACDYYKQVLARWDEALRAQGILK
jgi:hypothetical protein